VHEAELVLFDLDGTLFDHESAARDAVRGWLLGLDVKPTELLVDAWFDAETRHVAAWHRGELDWTEQRRERVREMLSVVGRPLDGTDAVDASFDGYLTLYVQRWRAFPDVEPALVMLERCGVPVAVLSNGQDEQQRQKLAAIGLSERVGSVFCSDQIGYSKPDIRAFRHVCAQLGVSPETVVHVGDHYELDVVAARAAGLQAIHLDRTATGPVTEPHRIKSLTELVGLL
jgi:putative hydrolase of the HAD superfamily